YTSLNAEPWLARLIRDRDRTLR
ncbi:MAG: hypothetical protein QOG56_2773, partial [Solirubrobacteraceae bacterium]|nr:hypothetical protein [Solirubrobacteraceae bacterium]